MMDERYDSKTIEAKWQKYWEKTKLFKVKEALDKEKYYRDNQPIEKGCDCFTCQNYSRGYLHHLFAIEDSLAWRLATIHNLRFYSRLIELLRKNRPV